MKEQIKRFYKYAKEALNFDRDVKIKLIDDPKNSENIFGKTAAYYPGTFTITLYTTGRHPKDILRSMAHELVHHMQNLRGDFDDAGVAEDGYAQKNPKLRYAEEEAFLQGNMLFRDYEDKEKQIMKESVVTDIRKSIQKNIDAEGENNHLLAHFGIYRGQNPGEIKIKAITMDAISAIADTLKEMGISFDENSLKSGIFVVKPHLTLKENTASFGYYGNEDIVVKLDDETPNGYSGTIYTPTTSWDFSGLKGPKVGSSSGIRIATDAISFGSYYTPDNRKEAPDWAPSEEVAQEISDAWYGSSQKVEELESPPSWVGEEKEDVGLGESFSNRNEKLMLRLFEKLVCISEDKIPGGEGDGKPDAVFDKDELKAGEEDEMEHTIDKAKAKEIAKDHLSSDPKYYSKLQKAGIDQ